jgi:hypothetical protein
MKKLSMVFDKFLKISIHWIEKITYLSKTMESFFVTQVVTQLRHDLRHPASRIASRLRFYKFFIRNLCKVNFETPDIFLADV